MLLATINSGTLIIALPDLERSLHTTLLELVWVILVYMIVSTVLVLTAGRLSDLFGRKTAYVARLRRLLPRLARRRLRRQRHGADRLAGPAGHRRRVPLRERRRARHRRLPEAELGLAMGTNTMVAAVGLVIGPVLGGALVAIAWPWVFWFNVPFGLVGSLWGLLVLHERSGRSEERGLDLLGIDHLRRRPDRARARALEGRALRLDEPARDRRASRSRSCSSPSSC